MTIAPNDQAKRVDPSVYNQEYFETGPIAGVSGYMNYRWMPELTIRMAHKFIQSFPIDPKDRVLDFGCAKGYLVRALRILDIEAYGVDISGYAIEKRDGAVSEFCRQISGSDDANLFDGKYDWMIAKDVFEHIHEPELRVLLQHAHGRVHRIFAAIPLGIDNECGKYVIAAYDQDVTHVLAKTFEWWRALFESEGWNLERAKFTYPGCKENWTQKWDQGNGFFILSSNKYESAAT